MSDKLEIIKLSCGCVMESSLADGTKTLAFKPCSPTCTNYANVVELARKEGKPIRTREP